MNRKDLRFIILLVTVAFLLRIFKIGSQSLWVDEILTITVSNPLPGYTIWDYLRYNLHGPLHSFVVYLLLLISSSDGWLRLPSAIAGAASIFYCYRWVELWLGRRIARQVAVMLVVHPLHIYYSQELRNYSFLFLAAVFSSYMLHKILKDERKSRLVAYVCGTAAAALSNFSAAFLYAVHSILYLFRGGMTGRRWLRWLIVSLAVLVLISPWVYRIGATIDVPKLLTPVKPGEIPESARIRGETTVILAAIPYTFYAFSVGFSMGPSTRELHLDTSISGVMGKHGAAVIWTGLLFGFLSLAGAVRLVRHHLPWHQVGLYLLVPLLLMLLLCWQNAKAFNIRYVLVSFPAYLCLLSAGLMAFRGPVRWVLLGLTLVTLVFSTGNYYFDGRYARENVRRAADYLEAKGGENECIFAPTISQVFRYYYGGSARTFQIHGPWPVTGDRLDAQLDDFLANCKTFWYVRAREWVHDPDGRVLEVLDAAAERKEVIDYEGVKIIKYNRKSQL
jgi:hypothetical protein